MSIAKNERLFDITMRQQMYIEGVKLDQVKQFGLVMILLMKELKPLLTDIKYNTLDQMTKTELNVLLVKIRRFQNRIYSQYTESLVNELQSFMRADVRQTKRVITAVNWEFEDEPKKKLPDDDDANEHFEEAEKDGVTPLFGWLPTRDNDEGYQKFWALILAAPIPGNGVLINSFIRNFSISAQASIENLIRQAYVNGWTIAETIESVEKQVEKVGGQAGTVAGTVLQQVAALVSAGVASAFFGRYRWVSVMDSRTSSICRDRNNQVYLFGYGPLPPAHLNCRSHITFMDSKGDEPNPTLYNWLSQQPLSFLVTVFSASAAAAIVSGKATPDDYQKFIATELITVEQFANKDASILTT